jgi:hypothetical protein
VMRALGDDGPMKANWAVRSGGSGWKDWIAASTQRAAESPPYRVRPWSQSSPIWMVNSLWVGVRPVRSLAKVLNPQYINGAC